MVGKSDISLLCDIIFTGRLRILQNSLIITLPGSRRAPFLFCQLSSFSWEVRLQQCSMQEQDNKREEGRLEGEVVKDKMPIVIVLVRNLRLRGREIRDLVFSLDFREKELLYVGVLCSYWNWIRFNFESLTQWLWPETKHIELDRNVPVEIWPENPEQTEILNEVKIIPFCFVFWIGTRCSGRNRTELTTLD